MNIDLKQTTSSRKKFLLLKKINMKLNNLIKNHKNKKMRLLNQKKRKNITSNNTKNIKKNMIPFITIIKN